MFFRKIKYNFMYLMGLWGTKKAVLLHRHSEMSGCDEVKRKTNKKKVTKKN